MEVFCFKSRKNYECFELKYLIFFMVLIPCIWTQDHIPSFNVTCDFNGMHMKITFAKPFSGVVFAKGHRFDPICSYSVTESSVLDGYLSLPITACSTYVQESDQPWITNTVVVQHHPLIRTTLDYEKSIICPLPQNFDYFWNSPLLLDQIYESHTLPRTKSSDIELGPYVFHKHSAEIFDNSYTHMNIFQLQNGTIYKDVAVKSCISHDAGILDGNASFHQINNPEGCFTVSSKNSSSLIILETEKGITAYVKAETLKMESSKEFYLTCEVLLCKTKCICPEIEQQTENPTSVISHKLTRRSTDLSSETFSLKQYEARTRYLRSTVKALMDSIMQQRKEKDSKTKVRKRAMRLDDSSFLPESTSLGRHAIIASTEIFSPKPVSIEFDNIEPHKDDLYNDYDHDYKEQDDYREQDDYSEEPSSTTELNTADTDTNVATLPKKSDDDSTKIVLDDELEKKGKTALTNDEVSPVNDVTENIKIVATDADFPSEVDGHIDHLGNCVPKVRFIIVIVVLGFFIGCLLLASCGMVLYIRKEKKRNKINDFLLYSIGF